jgi:hypothetical protein
MSTQIIPRDFPRYTMAVLQAALAHGDDLGNLRVCSHAVLRSAFNHLYALGFCEDDGDPGIGQGMCTLLVLTGDRT